MVQKTRKTLGFKKIMVYKIPPGGWVNHIWPLAYYFITSDTYIRKIRLIADITAELFKIKNCSVGNLFKYSII